MPTVTRKNSKTDRHSGSGTRGETKKGAPPTSNPPPPLPARRSARLRFLPRLMRLTASRTLLIVTRWRWRPIYLG